MYSTKNLPKKSQSVIDMLRQQALQNADAALQELQYLLSAISTYKEALSESLDISLEKADIVYKYKTKPTMGAYNLPAVMATTAATYDINSIKKDNSRMEELNDNEDETSSQKELYFKMIIGNFNDLSKRIKRIATNNISINAFLEQLLKATEA
jgi:predicted Zn-dependent protease